MVGQKLTKERDAFCTMKIQTNIIRESRLTGEEKFTEFQNNFPLLNRRELYIVYLKTIDWKTKRKAKMYQARYKCEKCESKKKLQVHHKEYKNWFDVELTDLLLLCDKCHKKEHNRIL